MPYKPRTKPKELIIMRFLNKREKLTSKEKQHYLNLKKGYKGEVQFDSLIENFQCECLILNDLLLEVNNTTFQIDTLIILQGKIYMFEVKNYEGDFYFESDKLYKKPKIVVTNPLHQLNRSETLLRQLLLSLGFNPQIVASVVFIHPTFTLYQAPLDKPIILPTQVESYLCNLNTPPSKLTEKHKKLASQLLSLHMTESPYSQIPSYKYDQLRKGITCLKCDSFSVVVGKRKCTCQDCKHEELVTNAVVRTVKEFHILFPDEKITTSKIHDWCQIVASEKRIRRILLSNFTKIGDHRWSYYK